MHGENFLLAVDSGFHYAAAYAGGELLRLHVVLDFRHLLLHGGDFLLKLRLTGGSGNLAVGKSTACAVTHSSNLLLFDFNIVKPAAEFQQVFQIFPGG